MEAHEGISRSPLTRASFHLTTLANANRSLRLHMSAFSFFEIRMMVVEAWHVTCPHEVSTLQAKEEYMACLREHGNQAKSCRSIAKRYLECRMERCVANGSFVFCDPVAVR